MPRLLILSLAVVMAAAFPTPAAADHDSDRRVVELQAEITDVVGAAREELHSLHQLLDAAESPAVRRELHRKAERIDELLARVPRLSAQLERAYGGAPETSSSVGVSVGGLGAGVVVVVDDGGPAAVVVVEEPSDDHAACSESDFAAVLRAVGDEAFSSGKLDILRDASIDRWYTSSQVRRMLDLFSFDNDKVEAAVIMHPRTVDLENWFKVHEAFTFDSSKDDLRERVGR